MKKDIKKYLPWIILLVLVISLSSWYILSKRITQEQMSLYEGKIQEAQAHVEARQFSMGMQKYYEAVDIVSSEVEAYKGIISILLAKNRLSDAQEVIEESGRALNNYDKSFLYKMVGDEYYNLKQYGKAYDMYDAGSFLGVNNMELELMLGKTYLNLGEVKDAKSQFNKTGYKGELLEEANLLLAYIYAIDDPQKAKTTLNSITDVEEVQIYYEEFEKILNSLDEDKKFNATKLARVYINNGYPYLAILALEAKEEEMMEYLEGMYFLGRAYFDYGQYDEAVEVLNNALTLGGMEEDILWIKARSYFLVNDLENAIKSYDSAIGHMGPTTNSDLVTEYVELLLENNQVLKASDLVRGLLVLDGEKPYFNLLAIEVNYELNEDTKVEYYLNQLEEMELNNFDEKEYLKWKVLSMLEIDSEKREEDVEEYLDTLFELDRFNPYYHFFLAKVELEEGNEEMAIQSLEQAIEYDLDYEITDEALKLLSSLR
jgi:tetratricopeptide (TPR) repeat protein